MRGQFWAGNSGLTSYESDINSSRLVTRDDWVSGRVATGCGAHFYFIYGLTIIHLYISVSHRAMETFPLVGPAGAQAEKVRAWQQHHLT